MNSDFNSWQQLKQNLKRLKASVNHSKNLAAIQPYPHPRRRRPRRQSDKNLESNSLVYIENKNQHNNWFNIRF